MGREREKGERERERESSQIYVCLALCPIIIYFISDSLAYLTAATHGLTEEADAMAESLTARLDKVRGESSNM